MKVLSIKEPFATLIKNEIKKIETRSFKTNYRGELYIHASISKIRKDIYTTKPELVKLFKNLDMGYGHILLKCNLVDCIYMSKEYIENIKNNNYQEYICGNYQEGRYAWILDNVEVLKEPIPVKGKLGIWNYNNVDKF